MRMISSSALFGRLFFGLLALSLFIAYVWQSPELSAERGVATFIGGTLFLGGIFLIEFFLKGRYSLKLFNVTTLGLFFGFLMAQVLLLVFSGIINMGIIAVQPTTEQFISLVILLLSLYAGVLVTARCAEELAVSIPFVRFKGMIEKKRDILLDASVIHDGRVVDLALSGLLDHHLVLPRFILNDLQSQLELPDEILKAKARRSMENIKKLESMPSLGLRYSDTDFEDMQETLPKLIRLARLTDASVLTADLNRIQQSEIEGVRVVNIHTLANLLKPVNQTGEYIQIKLDRYGKEPRQGVGYLEDGTMVVVNGAAAYIGQTIRARVLSVKRTTSGRMIFCNTMDEDQKEGNLQSASYVTEIENTSSRYFAQ